MVGPVGPDRMVEEGKGIFVRVMAMAAAVAAGLLVPAGPAMAEDVLDVRALIDGRDVSDASSSNPVVIDPATEQLIDITVTNRSGSPVTVRRVRLEGEVGA